MKALHDPLLSVLRCVYQDASPRAQERSGKALVAMGEEALEALEAATIGETHRTTCVTPPADHHADFQTQRACDFVSPPGRARQLRSFTKVLRSLRLSSRRPTSRSIAARSKGGAKGLVVRGHRHALSVAPITGDPEMPMKLRR
jgi:hypothetical protein